MVTDKVIGIRDALAAFQALLRKSTDKKMERRPRHFLARGYGIFQKEGSVKDEPKTRRSPVQVEIEVEGQATLKMVPLWGSALEMP